VFFSPVDPLPADADGMLDLQKHILRGLIPLWKKLGDERRAELTVSPYYHPLLPMIFDAAAAGPEAPPGVVFRHPGDGHTQIRSGREYFRKIFGHYPKGIWPSEGGISREAAAAIAEAGFAFAVTDENVLWKSLGRYDRKALFKPHRTQDLTVFFRDRELSDQIGFEYQHWKANDAVTDLLRRLDERRPDCDEDSLVVLALDGENPWGTYPQNGVPFLRELYARLNSHPGITPIFFEDYLARHAPTRELALTPGTWLGSFKKWAGCPAKNRGWEILARARKACGPLEEILIAEGSDWFWWFGEEHTEEFASLFELYIGEAYRRAGLTHE
jgi:alpha-amylase/alpha-mannosidase (GH57 family)